MKIAVKNKLEVLDTLYIFLSEKEGAKDHPLLSDNNKKQIEEVFKTQVFKGELGEILWIPSFDKKIKKIFLVGIGSKKVNINKITAFTIQHAIKNKNVNLGLLLPLSFSVMKSIQGAVFGNYNFKLTKEKTDKKITSVDIITKEKVSPAQIKESIALAEGENFARELVNLPPNLMTPPILAQKAKEISKGITNPIKTKILGEKQLEKLKMGSLLAVGAGSLQESQLIVMEYWGGKKSEKPIILAGKGVCFDSGGYNLKPTNYIEDMKIDMAGAGSVMGIFKYLSVAKPKKNIIGIIGSVENLINGKAFKPGDIITAMNGKTIEITNTDAEGRLVLADVLYYGVTKYKPELVFDFATLTGACVAALGHNIAGIMGNNKKHIESIKKAAEKADEEVWELPLNEFFLEKTKGTCSDLKNHTSGVQAGSSMGAAFLQNFVESYPWVHFDIAGTAFIEKPEKLESVGATGTMIRTIKYFIQNS